MMTFAREGAVGNCSFLLSQAWQGLGVLGLGVLGLGFRVLGFEFRVRDLYHQQNELKLPGVDGSDILPAPPESPGLPNLPRGSQGGRGGGLGCLAAFRSFQAFLSVGSGFLFSLSPKPQTRNF